MKVIIPLLLLMAILYAWERWRVRRIREETDELRRESHEIFQDLKDCVEHCHDDE
jgi:hypothetical protein